MLIEKWQAHFSGEPSEDAIRNRFGPAEKYRISRRSYPAGTRFSGGMLAGTCFVLKGQCDIAFRDDCASLGEMEFVRMPGGSYTLAVDAKKDAELVFVWEIPSAAIVDSKNTSISVSIGNRSEPDVAADPAGIL